MTARPLLVATAAAPVLACLLLSPLLMNLKLGPLGAVPFGAALLPMIFAVPGALLLLGVYVLLRKGGVPPRSRYAALVAVGVVAGGLALSQYDRLEIMLGSLYGGVTALLWAVIHARFSKREEALAR